MAFPFPFFGSGSASYFEWFEMWVWFEKPVTKKARAALLKGAPPPCKEDASWPMPELLWASNGDQFIGMHIINAYPNVVEPTGAGDAEDGDAGDDDDSDDDDDDVESRFVFAKPAQERAFNKAIEAWLLEIHKTQPIAFAARGEDSEAGGTELDDWHDESVKQIGKLVPLFEAQVAKKNDHARYPIKLALGYARDARIRLSLSTALTEWLASESDGDDGDDEEEGNDE